MPQALAAGNIYLAYFKRKNTDDQLQRLILSCIEFHKTNNHGLFCAIIILFESEFNEIRLLRAHIQAKPTCIKNEIMLGALYKNSQAPSLHSKEYFPLRTPIPTLVLRDLTAQDLQFLTPDHYEIFEKLEFLNSFINKFSNPSTKTNAKSKVNKAISLRRLYIFHILFSCGVVFLAIASAVALMTTIGE